MAQYLPGVSFALGLWLLVAPYALGFTDQTWNSLVIGAVSTVAGLLAGYQEWWHPTTQRG